MSARFSIEFEFTDALGDRAASSFVRTRQKDGTAKFWKALPGLLLYTLISGMLLWFAYLVEIPDWLLVLPLALAMLFGGILALLLTLHAIALFFEAIWRWRIRRQLGAAFPYMADRTVRWTFTDDKFEVHSAVKNREVPWSSLIFVRPDPEFWVIGIKEGPELLLPVEYLTPDVQKLILAKAESIGADDANPTEHK